MAFEQGGISIVHTFCDAGRQLFGTHPNVAFYVQQEMLRINAVPDPHVDIKHRSM
jgi:hypothetical protein